MENTIEIEEDCVLSNEDSAKKEASAAAMTSNSGDEILVSKSTPSTPLAEKRTKNCQIPTPSEKLNKSSQKLELAKKRQEEKEKKEREKKEREEMRLKKEDEQKKKKQEEERLRQKRLEEKEKQNQERLEKERKRQEQTNLRNEEKRKRDEEKKKIEEEKKRLEEEKQREEEEKRRKEEKVKSHFVNYFIKKENSSSQNSEKDDQKSCRFMPFQVKANMFLAPLCRRHDIINMTVEQKEDFMKSIDEIVSVDGKYESTYLKEIRENAERIRHGYKAKIRRSRPKTAKTYEPNKIDDLSNDEIKLIQPVNIESITENMTKFRVKYLHFDPKVYRRPPYYGTWKKKSKIINPRNPFAKDDKMIDYDVDSDDEWEDEADGESIADSDKGDMEEDTLNGGDDEDDDGFFVPHGHLSDDELDEEERNLDSETKRAKEAAKSEQWETERKKTSKHLVPKYFYQADYWDLPDKIDLDKARFELKHLNRLQMVPLVPSFPIVISNEISNQQKTNDDQPNKSTKASSVENLSSPVVSKPKSNKQKTNLNSPASQSPSTLNNQNSINSKGSIMKFISKYSNKTCNIEAINSTNSDQDVLSLNSPSSNESSNLKSSMKSLCSSASKLENIISSSKKCNDGDMINETTDSFPKLNNNTPTLKLRKGNSTVILNKPSPSTPLNGKINSGTTNTTAEKRACNENSESAVKRLKLDDSNLDGPKSASKSISASPILSFLKNSSCRKNLRLSSCEIDISEETITKKNDSVKFDSPSLKKSIDLDSQCKMTTPNVQAKTKKDDSSVKLSPRKVSNNVINRNDTNKNDTPMDTCESIDQQESNQTNKENNDKIVIITID